MPVYMSKKSKAEMRARRKKLRESGKTKGGQSSSDSQTNSQPHSAQAVSEPPSKKRRRDGVKDQDRDGRSESWGNSQSVQPQIIRVPADLSGKDAKKFRKDVRRKVRAEGRDDSLLRFVVDGKAEKEEARGGANEGIIANEGGGGPRKKPRTGGSKKSFPRINDLLAAHEAAQKAQKEAQARLDAEEKIPDSVKARYVALDCEMVGVGSDGKQSALARASLVDWHGKVLLDTFVQVPDRVTDFRTFVSGIRAKDIKVTNEKSMELQECRRRVGMLLKDKILVGHALKNDFTALMLDHPPTDIRDTAKYRPFMRVTGKNGGKLRPRKLRDLVKEHVGKEIQVKGEAHCSVDDARATMDLYKVVRDRWEKDILQGGRKVWGKK